MNHVDGFVEPPQISVLPVGHFIHREAEADVLAALQKMAAAPVHMVISDYNMPGMDGLQLLQTLRGTPQTARTGFILITGTTDAAVLDKGKQLGMNNFLKKPFSPTALKACIERVVGPL